MPRCLRLFQRSACQFNISSAARWAVQEGANVKEPCMTKQRSICTSTLLLKVPWWYRRMYRSNVFQLIQRLLVAVFANAFKRCVLHLLQPATCQRAITHANVTVLRSSESSSSGHCHLTNLGVCLHHCQSTSQSMDSGKLWQENQVQELGNQASPPCQVNVHMS